MGVLPRHLAMILIIKWYPVPCSNNTQALVEIKISGSYECLIQFLHSEDSQIFTLKPFKSESYFQL